MTTRNIENGSEREAVLLKVATMYYKGGHTQNAIASKLGISRPTVVRMLQKARETGLVEIRITKALPITIILETLLESALSETSLKDCVVVDSAASDAVDNVAHAAASYLNEHVNDESIVGIGWSSTLAKLPRHIDVKTQSPSRIVQLGGHAGRAENANAQEISLRLGDLLTCEVEPVPAPVIVASNSVRDSLRKDPVISRTRKWVARCNIGFVGIGVISKRSRLVEAGYLRASHMKKVADDGAIGEVLSHCYNLDGRMLSAPWDDRSLTVSLRNLRRIEDLVGVAAGVEKVDCTLGAVRAGLINTLIIDSELAKGLLHSLDVSVDEFESAA